VKSGSNVHAARSRNCFVESAANQLGDECAATPASGPLVEFGDELVVNGNVQSRVLNLAH